MTTPVPPDDVIALTTRLILLGKTSTAEQFSSRLETITILYGYLERRFEERFPTEFAKWVAEKEGDITE
jgi:hypothetical protein